MKHFRFKKRFIILGVIILITVIVMGYYINYIGDMYEMKTGFFFGDSEVKNVMFRPSRDDIVVMSDYYLDDEGELILSLISDNEGEIDAVISATYGASEETAELKTHFSVNDMGTIIEDRSGILNCNGYMEITYSVMGQAALIMCFMIFSFIECLRKNLFSYSMVIYGGVALYLFILLVMVVYKLLNNAVNSLSALFWLLLEIGEYFLILMLPIMLIMALSVSVSNIWLMRHEGFRPVNALGIAISVVWLIGICLVLGIGVSYMFSIDVLRQLRGAFTYIICYFECMLTSVIVCAFSASRHSPPYDRDYIIILGCAIRTDGSLTPLLKGRVDSALSFEKRQHEQSGRHACFVPSGGQGADEVISEGEAMERYLLEQGVPSERILREDKSVNTFENMKLSYKVMSNADHDLRDKKIAFATTNYHVFRGYILSKKNGFEAQGISAKTKWYFFPNAFLREFIGMLVDKLAAHIAFLVILALIVWAVEFFL